MAQVRRAHGTAERSRDERSAEPASAAGRNEVGAVLRADDPEEQSMTPRQQSILEIVARHTHGIQAKDLAVEACISINTLRDDIIHLRNDGHLLSLRTRCGAIWTTPELAPPIFKNIKETIEATRKEKKSRQMRAYRERKQAGQIPKRKLGGPKSLDADRWEQIRPMLEAKPMTIREINALWCINLERANQIMRRLRDKGLTRSMYAECHRVVWVPVEHYETHKAEALELFKANTEARKRRNNAQQRVRKDAVIEEFSDLPIVRILRSANEAPPPKTAAVRWVFDLGGVAA
jgi:DNA-binding CsgD family transcriptional regulator